MTRTMINKLTTVSIAVTAFCFGLNLDNRSSLFSIILLMLSVFHLNKTRTLRFQVSKFSLILIATLFTYTFISMIHYDDPVQEVITYLVLPAASYLTGYFLIKRKQEEHPIHNLVIFSASLGFFLFGMLNILARYRMGYDELWWVAAGRLCANYWTGVEMWPTLEATYFLGVSALLFYVLVINKHFGMKLIFLGVIATTAWAASEIGSRTVIVVPFAMCCFFLFYYLKSSKVMQSKKIKLFLQLLMVISAILVLYQTNTFGVRTTFEASNLYSRMTGKTYDSVNGLLESNGREVRYYKILDEMPTHPFGGIDLGGDVLDGGLGSAHNTWLDVYRIAGIVPFVLFIICTIMLYRRMRQLIGNYTLFHEKTMPLISVLIIINIQFLSESMFVLNTQLLNFYFMLCGMVDCIYLMGEPALTREKAILQMSTT